MKISIVTPTYNQAATLRETLDSVLAQGLGRSLQYIVVDGLSNDTTPAIVDEYAARFRSAGTEFLSIREADSGQADAINKGWKRCTGEILGFLNSDDLFTDGALSRVRDFFSGHPETQWAYGGWNLVDGQGRIHCTIAPARYEKRRLLNYSNIGQPACFFRRRLLDEFGMLDPNLHLAMDYDLWLRFAARYDAGIIPYVLAAMRYHASAKSSQQTRRQLAEILKLGTRYTHPLSWRRLMQYFYYLRGLAVILLRIDISRRIYYREQRKTG